MKTISKIKNEVAKVKYDSSFNQAMSFMHKLDFDYFIDEVAKRYAEEMAISFGQSIMDYEGESQNTIAFDSEESTIEDLFEIFKKELK